MRSTAAAWRLFDLVRRPWMALRLRIHLTGLPSALPPRGRILLVSNHESFWDGFILRDVQRALRPRGSFHAVMLERELIPRPWLRALGGLGAAPGSLAAGRRLLRSIGALPADAVLGFLPQGHIRPGSPRPLGFQAGVGTVRAHFCPVAVLPVALRVVGGRTPRSEAYVTVGPPLRPRGRPDHEAHVLEEAVGTGLDAIDAFLDRHGEDAPEAWPDRESRLDPPPPDWLTHGPEPWLSRN